MLKMEFPRVRFSTLTTARRTGSSGINIEAKSSAGSEDAEWKWVDMTDFTTFRANTVFTASV